MQRRGVAHAFASAHLLDAVAHRGGQINTQHMVDSGEKVLAGVAVIDEISVLGDLAHRGLEYDAVEPQPFLPALPPARRRVEYLGEFRFGNAVAFPGLPENFAADTTTTGPREPSCAATGSANSGPPLKAPLVRVMIGICVTSRKRRLLPDIPRYPLARPPVAVQPRSEENTSE